MQCPQLDQGIKASNRKWVKLFIHYDFHRLDIEFRKQNSLVTDTQKLLYKIIEVLSEMVQTVPVDSILLSMMLSSITKICKKNTIYYSSRNIQSQEVIKLLMHPKMQGLEIIWTI